MPGSVFRLHTGQGADGTHCVNGVSPARRQGTAIGRFVFSNDFFFGLLVILLGNDASVMGHIEILSIRCTPSFLWTEQHIGFTLPAYSSNCGKFVTHTSNVVQYGSGPTDRIHRGRAHEGARNEEGVFVGDSASSIVDSGSSISAVRSIRHRSCPDVFIRFVQHPVFRRDRIHQR